jgi:hypothetical protein
MQDPFVQFERFAQDHPDDARHGAERQEIRGADVR